MRGTITNRRPTFRFSSPDLDATFACRLDSGPYKPCRSPRTTRRLTNGPHTFRVRATDPNGTDPTPAVRRFAVKSQPRCDGCSSPGGAVGFLCSRSWWRYGWLGDRFNPYAICRHGIRGHPRTDPAFTTLGGHPLRFNGRGSPPRSTYRFSFSHDRWRTTLLAFHAPHQSPPDLQVKAVNHQESRKVLFFWRCEHPQR